MKPSEETWAAGAGQSGRFLFDAQGNAIAEFAGPDSANILAQVKLAAQAPAMARLLARFATGDFWNGQELTEARDRARIVLRAAGVLP